ncbi:MAG TPA: Sua5/YciO/YrdC/YwlC family protein, partial [Pirellulaceae bacterium]|nr:Sua5/YciO/YrdC/YwlC family protein [Pirellulaceae bacterium]
MTAMVYDLRRLEESRDLVHRAVEALAQGKILVVPTETVYGLVASGLHAETIERLAALKTQAPKYPNALAFGVKSADDALDYCPDFSPLARRLARRCWPGPLTIVTPALHRDSVVQRLPKSVRNLTMQPGTIALRAPAHEFTMQVFRLNAGPVILTTVSEDGQTHATTVDEIPPSIRAAVDVIFDAGPCRFSQPSTIVRIDGNRWTVLRPGVMDSNTIKRMSQVTIMLVCTGNTCRSPMAAGILKTRLAQRLGLTVESLAAQGVHVVSAGVAAMSGAPASPQAVQVGAQMGFDLSEHGSQPVSDRLVQDADLILTMTDGHRQAIISRWPQAASRTFLVARNQNDVSDPIGLPVECYA